MTAYTAEERAFFEEYVPGHHHRETAEEFKRRFGRGISVKQVGAYVKNHRLSTGFTGRFEKGHAPANKGKRMPPEVYGKCRGTMFKPGQAPHNTRKVGSVSVHADGYAWVKVRDDMHGCGNIRELHKVVWEEHNGPIPEGMMVAFLDGDRGNCDISNLALVSRAEHAVMNNKKRRSRFPEVTAANIALTRLELAAAGKRNEAADGGEAHRGNVDGGGREAGLALPGGAVPEQPGHTGGAEVHGGAAPCAGT